MGNIQSEVEVPTPNLDPTKSFRGTLQHASQKRSRDEDIYEPTPTPAPKVARVAISSEESTSSSVRGQRPPFVTPGSVRDFISRMVGGWSRNSLPSCAHSIPVSESCNSETDVCVDDNDAKTVRDEFECGEVVWACVKQDGYQLWWPAIIFHDLAVILQSTCFFV
jgi:hypothetical protein